MELRNSLCPYRYLRGVWDGLVAVGMLHALGDIDPGLYVRRGAVYDEPVPEHPQRPRPTVQRRVAGEMNRDLKGRRGRGV